MDAQNFFIPSLGAIENMKSVQDRQQSHNILYGNHTDHASSNAKVSQHCSPASSYGHNIHSTSQSHFLYSGNVGGYRQSLSGSETDLSTSTENLTHEEKYVLRNSTRQEPQGEETLNAEDPGSGCGGGGGGGGGVGTFRGGGSSYTSMDQSSCSTLIIHKDCEGDFEDEYEDDDEDDARNSHSVDTRQKYVPNRNGLVYSGEVRPELHHHSSPGYYSGSVPYHSCQLLQKQQQQSIYQGQNSFSVSPYCKMDYASHYPPEMSGISKQYLDQSEVLKHLAKEMHPSTSACASQTSALKMSDALIQSASYSNHYGSSIGPAVSQAFFGTEFDLSKLPPPPEYPGHTAPQSKSSSMGSTLAAMNSCVASSPSGLQTPVPSTLTASTKSASPPSVCTTTTTATTTNKCILSRSQPDLSQLGRWDDIGVRRNNYLSQRPKTKGKASPDLSPALLHQRVHDVKYGAGNLSTMDFLAVDKHLEAVEEENRRLKSELEIYTTKVSKLQKFEVDIQKVHNAYEDLKESSNKQHRLNQRVRTKLELEVCRLKEQNKEQKEQLDAANSHLLRRHLPIDSDGNSDFKREIQRRDQMIAQLIQQNKELMAAKERHEIELAAQRATLQEQRSHIDILDSALTNAQANVLKLEEECRKKQAYVERVAQLQKALTALQVVSERREEMERKLRKQLEMDLQEARQQLSQKEAGNGHKAQCSNASKKLQTGGDSANRVEMGGQEMLENGDFSNSSDAVGDLKRVVREKEERIIALETEVSKWEQRYLEENAMRQIAIDAASMPKDAKIAALERTSQESEKLIAQARSEKLKQMDELHASHKRCADMESKIKDLESHLAERDAMIKVLQKHSMERDAALQSAMLRSPLHTPHPSFHTVTASSTATTTTTIRGSSLSAVPTEEKADSSSLGSSVPVSLPNVTPAMASTNDATCESLDEQLKKLDSQLLSKDSIIHALRSEKEKYPSHYWMV